MDVSCPSVSVCVAVDDAGNAFTTRNPTGGPGAWKRTLVDPGINAGEGGSYVVNCPSVTRCIASYYGGDVVMSHHPTGDARAWSVINPYQHPNNLGGGVTGISCGSPAECEVIDDAGYVHTFTGPSSQRWATRLVDQAGSLRAVACPSRSLCIAVDNLGNVIVGSGHIGGPKPQTCHGQPPTGACMQFDARPAAPQALRPHL
jgi:hypothetical protein